MKKQSVHLKILLFTFFLAMSACESPTTSANTPPPVKPVTPPIVEKKTLPPGVWVDCVANYLEPYRIDYPGMGEGTLEWKNLSGAFSLGFSTTENISIIYNTSTKTVDGSQVLTNTSNKTMSTWLVMSSVSKVTFKARWTPPVVHSTQSLTLGVPVLGQYVSDGGVDIFSFPTEPNKAYGIQMENKFDQALGHSFTAGVGVITNHGAGFSYPNTNFPSFVSEIYKKPFLLHTSVSGTAELYVSKNYTNGSAGSYSLTVSEVNPNNEGWFLHPVPITLGVSRPSKVGFEVTYDQYVSTYTFSVPVKGEYPVEISDMAPLTRDLTVSASDTSYNYTHATMVGGKGVFKELHAGTWVLSVVNTPKLENLTFNLKVSPATAAPDPLVVYGYPSISQVLGLDWPVVSNAITYKVYLGSSATGPWVSQGVSTYQNTFQIKNLINAQDYWFKVTSVNSLGESSGTIAGPYQPQEIWDLPFNTWKTFYGSNNSFGRYGLLNATGFTVGKYYRLAWKTYKDKAPGETFSGMGTVTVAEGPNAFGSSPTIVNLPGSVSFSNMEDGYKNTYIFKATQTTYTVRYYTDYHEDGTASFFVSEVAYP